MSYQGNVFRIPVGSRGLTTDEVQSRGSIDALLKARNVSFYKQAVEKEPGSIRWNRTAQPSPILALSDYWPTDVQQRLFTVGADALLRRFIDIGSSSIVGPASTSDVQALTLASNRPPCFVIGGNENNSPRKLFLFTGTSQVQVVEGDAAVRRNIALPALDWDQNSTPTGKSFPTAGCIHAGRLACWGNENQPSMLYLSSATDHGDFQTNGAALFFPIFPGEGEGILTAYTFKGRLFIFKRPYGIYFLNDSDPSPSNWSVQRLTLNFGAASAFSCAEGLNDLFVANVAGSITQMSATLDFGSMETGDLLRNLKNAVYAQQTTSPLGTQKRYGIWYDFRKTLYFAFQSAGGIKNDLLLKIDFNDPATPKVSWSDKDQANCLALVKDSIGILRPFYGANDGYIYQLDTGNCSIANSIAYTGQFKITNLDFGQLDPSLAEREKLFDFVEVSFEERGNWNLSIDVYIDNFYTETLQANMGKRYYLDSKTSPAPAPGSFLLGPTGINSALGRALQSTRLPLHGKGRRISFDCYNSGLNQGFCVTDMAVYFRLSGNAQEA